MTDYSPEVLAEIRRRLSDPSTQTKYTPEILAEIKRRIGFVDNGPNQWAQQNPITAKLEDISKHIADTHKELTDIPSSLAGGFWAKPLNKNTSMTQKIASGVGENIAPAGLAMLAAPLNVIAPGASIAAAMVGKSAQKVAQQARGLVDLSYQAPSETPLQTAGEVAGAGVAEFAGQKIAEGAGALYRGVKANIAKAIAKGRGLRPEDVVYAMDNPSQVFTGKSKKDIVDFYRQAATNTDPQLDMPGFATGTDSPKVLLGAKDYLQKESGNVNIPNSEWDKLANVASRAILKDGGRVVLPTGESRLFTAQDALTGIHAINKLEFEKEASTLVNPDEVKTALYDFLENNGFPKIREAAAVARGGKIAGRFDDVFPKSGQMLLGGAGIALDAVGIQQHNKKIQALGMLTALSSSPFLQGKAIQYGSPLFSGVVAKLAPVYGNLAPMAAQALVSEINASNKKSVRKDTNFTTPEEVENLKGVLKQAQIDWSFLKGKTDPNAQGSSRGASRLLAQPMGNPGPQANPDQEEQDIEGIDLKDPRNWQKR